MLTNRPPLSTLVILTLLVAIACATPYQVNGFRGGFDDIQLGDSLFQISFQGNGFTQHGRVAQLLLRRCAELSLENGARYFLMENSEQRQTYSGAGGNFFTFPDGQAIIRLMISNKENTLAIDAVMVVEQTASMAKNRLSPEAQAMIQELIEN